MRLASRAMECDPDFLHLLVDFDLQALELNRESVYGCWSDWRLAYVNRGWSKFAEQNHGESLRDWPLGRRVLDSIPDPLLPYFELNMQRCLSEDRPWEHDYECSSATTYRLFHMITFPLAKGAGFLVVNSLRQESPHSRIPSPPCDDIYRNSFGIMTQCCHCRRIRRAGAALVWDWVPEWVESQPSHLSHGICEPCQGFHYPNLRARGDDVIEHFQS